MRGGTTQPTLSEDLWAQVAALKPGSARLRRSAPDGGRRSRRLEQTWVSVEAWRGRP